MQYVSKEPATRLDVITLQETLDKRLVERQAREKVPYMNVMRRISWRQTDKISSARQQRVAAFGLA